MPATLRPDDRTLAAALRSWAAQADAQRWTPLIEPAVRTQRQLRSACRDRPLSRGDPMFGPVLFCYDGSEDSGAAMAAAGELIARPAPAVVLTVWQTARVLLARAGGFAVGFGDEQQFDAQEAKLAWQAAQEAAARGASSDTKQPRASSRRRRAQHERSSRWPMSSTRGWWSAGAEGAISSHQPCWAASRTRCLPMAHDRSSSSPRHLSCDAIHVA